MSDKGAQTWGHDSHRLISVDEAWQIIQRNVQPRPSVELAVQQAQSRVLAEPVRLSEDFPPFDKAMMDGYAVRSADCLAARARLKVIGAVAAGGDRGPTLVPLSAVRINTGAQVPQGADAVVRIEDITADGDHVIVAVPVSAGKALRLRGSDRKKGDLVLSAPVRLGPAQLAAAASAGAATVTVTETASVAILPNGDELVVPGQHRGPGQTYESNEIALCALARQFGGEPIAMGIARDDKAELTKRLTCALEHPVVITAGGMSMGSLDLVPQVCVDLGIVWQFHGVDMRPGKPVAYGRGPQGQHVIGLPGNPVSVFVCAWLFARMIIRGLQGLPMNPSPTVRARLSVDLPAARDRRPAYLPGRFGSHGADGVVVRPVAWSGSDDCFGLAEANCLLVRPDPLQSLAAGAGIECIPLGDDWE